MPPINLLRPTELTRNVSLGPMGTPSRGFLQHFVLGPDSHVIRTSFERLDCGTLYWGSSTADCLAALPPVWRARVWRPGIAAPSGPVTVIEEKDAALFGVRRGREPLTNDLPLFTALYTPCPHAVRTHPLDSVLGFLRDGRRLAVVTPEQALEHVLAWKTGLLQRALGRSHGVCVRREDPWSGMTPLDAMPYVPGGKPELRERIGIVIGNLYTSRGLTPPEPRVPLQSLAVEF